MSEASRIIERFRESTLKHYESCGRQADFVIAGSVSYEELLGAAMAMIGDDLKYPIDGRLKGGSKFKLFGFEVLKTYAVSYGFFPATKDPE